MKKLYLILIILTTILFVGCTQNDLPSKCSEKVEGIGKGFMSFQWFEYDNEKNTCIEKTVSGSDFKSPFKTKQECKSVCEKELNNSEQNFWPSELKLENGVLYCEFGDINDQKPSVGYYYSKQEIKIVSSPENLVFTSYTKASDGINNYYFESICSMGMPASCGCNFEIIS